MASSDLGARLTVTHRQQQMTLARRAIAEQLILWGLLDPAALEETSGAWLAVALQSILRYRQVSRVLTANYMQQFRVAEIGEALDPPSGFTRLSTGAVIPVETDTGEVRQMIGKALQINGPIEMRKRFESVPKAEKVKRDTWVSVSRVTQKGVLDGGREVSERVASADPRVAGAARVTSGDACYFCTMLASRGFAYVSGETAHFQAHTDCSCVVEVGYSGTRRKLPPSTVKAQEQWKRFTEENPYPGGNSVQNFRRWLNGSKVPAA